jgi:pyruvate dehydrogenase E2 component (dihydrolipoamide acetyltransferase)
MIGKILCKVGDVLPCNSVLAVILDDGEILPVRIPAMIGEDVAPKSEVQSKTVGTQTNDIGDAQGQQADGRIYVSPSAKKLARELGVDIEKVVPSGNQIRREDIERAYTFMQTIPTAPRKDAQEVSKKPYSGIRKLTGDAMAISVHTTARVALTLDINAEKLINKRMALAFGVGKISYNVLIAQAATKALREFPKINSRLVGDEIWEMGHINIGIAVETDRGLLVPVLRDVDQKSEEVLHNEFSRLVERAQAGKATQQDLEEGTFTITNLGQQEIESFVPVIRLPECAILAVGAIMPKAIVVEGMVSARPMMSLTLVFDHRLVDGFESAKFLQRIKHLLEE